MTASNRKDWLDIARGIGIILVVLGHTLRGVEGAGLFAGREAWFQDADRIIYAFHMPFFFLLSGYLAPRMKVPSIGTALWARCIRLLYPLILWTYIFLAFRALAGTSANSGGGFADLLTSPLPPVAHFWFLWALFLLQALLVFILAAKRPGPAGWWAFFGATLALQFALPLLPGAMAPWALQAILHAPYFALGAALGASNIVPPQDKAALFWGLAGLVAMAILATSLAPMLWPGIALAVAMSAAALAISGGISARFSRDRAGRALIFLGQISLTIYVSHTIFSAGFRVVLFRLGIDSLPVHVLIGTVAGLALPAILHITLQKLRMRRLLGLP